MHEWSLLLFTLFVQIAAGGITALALVQTFGSKDASLKEIGFFALIAGIGACFSLTHLGDMFGAYRALYNPASSWLSREAWVTGAFAGAVVLCAFLAWRGKSWSKLLMSTAILGLVAVYASSAVYASTVMEKWRASSPCVEFFASTFLIGPFIVAFSRRTQRRDLFLTGGLSALGLLLLILNLGMYGGTYDSAFAAVRFLAIGIGFVTAIFTMLGPKHAAPVGVFATVCLVLGEGLGRYLFFM